MISGGPSLSYLEYKVNRHIEDYHDEGLGSYSRVLYNKHDFSYASQELSYGGFLSYSLFCTNGLFTSCRVGFNYSTFLIKHETSYGYTSEEGAPTYNSSGMWTYVSSTNTGTITEKNYGRDALNCSLTLSVGKRYKRIVGYGSLEVIEFKDDHNRPLLKSHSQGFVLGGGLILLL